MSRYLCGGAAIQEFRLVSRKRIALIESGVDYDDQEARGLSTLIQIYNKTVQKLATTKITKARLCNANKELRPGEQHAGKFRKRGILFKKNLEGYAFKPPGPDKLNDLMGEWARDVNGTYLELDDILKLYAIFLKIHPFSDGNGRTSRALLAALFRKHGYEYIHPDLFRFGKFGTEFIKGLRSLQKDTKHEFWQEWRVWSQSMLETIKVSLDEVKKTLDSRKTAWQFPELSLHLVESLWDNPIVFKTTLLARLSCKNEDLEIVIDDLVKTGILTAKRIRNKNQDIVYEAPMIVDCWHSIDDLLFEEEPAFLNEL